MFIHETNWLGSDSIYYNTATGISGPRINDVFSHETAELNREGLQNYLTYGFSAFGTTPIQNVRFTLPNTKLLKNSAGEFYVEDVQDPILQYLSQSSDETISLNKIDNWMQDFYQNECDQDDLIVLPLSGGLDSRMLAYYSRGKKNLRTFSYGTTPNQLKCKEVKLGEEVAKATNLKWQHVSLGDFHKYLALNDSVYGPSTHSHSMYHFEFYSNIKELLPESKKVRILSGIYGDVWAGSWNFEEIRNPLDLRKLAVTHGMKGSERLIESNTPPTESERRYFERNIHLLKDPVFRVVAAARLKIILIRHLLDTPESMGFQATSPFLNMEIAASMLSINPERRLNRRWQVDFLENVLPLNAKSVGKIQTLNVSDMFGALKVPVPKLLSTEGTPPELEQILRHDLSTKLTISKFDFLYKIYFEIPVLSRILNKIRFKRRTFLQDYSDYMLMYPLVSIFGAIKRSKE